MMFFVNQTSNEDVLICHNSLIHLQTDSLPTQHQHNTNTTAKVGEFRRERKRKKWSRIGNFLFAF